MIIVRKTIIIFLKSNKRRKSTEFKAVLCVTCGHHDSAEPFFAINRFFALQYHHIIINYHPSVHQAKYRGGHDEYALQHGRLYQFF